MLQFIQRNHLMRTTSAGVLLTTFLLTVSPAIELAAQHPRDVPAVPGQLFVKVNAPSGSIFDFDTSDNVNFIGDPALETIIKKFGIHKISRPFHLNDEKLKSTYLVEFSPNMDHQYLIATLSALDYVDYAEQVPAYNLVLTPNDLNSNQWHLPQIMAEQAWDLTTGSSNVVVAIVDDAVLTSHEDLAPVIWTNTGEIPGNGIDDEANGYIDDVNGWDAANGDNDPNPDGPTNSYFTHGTHCAGITGAATNNSIGIASIGYNIQIMPVKTASTGNGTLVAPYLGVQYAIANDADIISMSWGGSGYSNTYQNLFNFAHNQGIVLIAAAGNSNSSVLFYPASYNHMISVGATNSSDQKAWFSNYGDSIDVMAPGKDIWSCLAGSNTSYGYMSGTSMACPLVSGLAALMLSRDPSLSPDELEACLESSCDNIDGLNPSYVGQMGAGRINAYEALACLKPISADFSADFTTVCPGDTVQFTDLTTNNPIAWQWSFPGGFPSSSTAQNPAVIYNASGIYPVMLIATNADSVDTIIKSNYITVGTPSATISGSTNIALGYSANLRIDLTGAPNWSITYSDGTVNTTINNITNSPFFINVSPTVNTTYTLVSVSDNGCIGTVADSATITVISSLDTTCFKLQPGAALGNDVLLNGRPSQVNNNFGTHPDILAAAWTYGGIPGNLRCLLDFDLSSIPGGSAIISADLSLFYNPTSGNAGHSSLSGSNVSLLSRVTSTWDEMTVTWNTQPSVTALNEVILPQSITTTQDYPNIDVTAMVQDMVDNPATSFGFRFKLITESYYRSMLFASSDNADSTNWPMLEICYVSPSNSNSPCPTLSGFQKISDTQGNFTGGLNLDDVFGYAACDIGDLDQDGVPDIAVGAHQDGDGGFQRGAVWIIFLNPDGTSKAYQKISSTQGGFVGPLSNSDKFASSVCNMGDIAVSAHLDDDGSTDRGAVYILFLNSNGTVKSEQKISSTQGGFGGSLISGDRFGLFLSAIGDLDGDGVNDLSVGEYGDNDGGTNRGAVWILFMNSNGTVKSEQKISDLQGNFTGVLDNVDRFAGVAGIGDLNKDGIFDLAVGAEYDDDGGTNTGAVWILFLDTNGTVLSHQKISSTQGNFPGGLDAGDQLGRGVYGIGDWDGDGVRDIMVGAPSDDDGGADKGAAWIMYLNTDGTVKDTLKISDITFNFNGQLGNTDRF
ncbi:MAG TPA: DNRLRE domain-containing protein, partial [Flavobacteriales bacterium]|nr:DNRLRE domain-containing protein [Flavobacteriales bacterium]